MRSVEMKNRCLLYYGNPVGYRTEQGVASMTACPLVDTKRRQTADQP